MIYFLYSAGLLCDRFFRDSGELAMVDSTCGWRVPILDAYSGLNWTPIHVDHFKSEPCGVAVGV